MRPRLKDSQERGRHVRYSVVHTRAAICKCQKIFMVKWPLHEAVWQRQSTCIALQRLEHIAVQSTLRKNSSQCRNQTRPIDLHFCRPRRVQRHNWDIVSRRLEVGEALQKHEEKIKARAKELILLRRGWARLKEVGDQSLEMNQRLLETRARYDKAVVMPGLLCEAVSADWVYHLLLVRCGSYNDSKGTDIC